MLAYSRFAQCLAMLGLDSLVSGRTYHSVQESPPLAGFSVHID